MTVKAIDTWRSNAELIADVAKLGYLRDDWFTLDPTYGEGTFWKVWKPKRLIALDIDGGKTPSGQWMDFTDMPFADHFFDAVVFDPPYKLNGTPDPTVDARYGVDQPTRWQDRMELCRAGIRECARVLGDGYLLVKCQNQVCSGKIRWQSIDFTRTAEECGLGLVDMFHFLSYRAQPADRRQVHARQNSSQLLVFKRGW